MAKHGKNRLFSGEWFNEQLEEVAQQVSDQILTVFMEDILINGIIPGEVAIKAELVKKLDDDQFDFMMQQSPAIQETVLDMAKELDK